jgi:catechol 2,3-dioxygenase-like lactoylglutathione lyase family enzyme
MAKIKSIAALVFYVKDLDKTKKFYEDLGFRFEDKKGDYLKAYINWFSVEFYKRKADNADSGAHIQINVDDVNEFYKDVVSKGMKPEGEPEDIPAGRREFLLLDPDGYKLVFFTKK